MTSTSPDVTDVVSADAEPHHPHRSIFREVALWIGAIIGVFCILTSVGAFVFGITPLVFRSGSMSPGIPTGSFAIAVRTDADKLKVGDIVSVEWTGGVRVTHRIAAIDPRGTSVQLTTKGDANDDTDLERPVVADADRVIWSVPWWGYVYEELSKPQYVFFGGVAAGMLLLASLRAPGRGVHADHDRRRTRRIRRSRTRGPGSGDGDGGGGGGGGGGSDRRDPFEGIDESDEIGEFDPFDEWTLDWSRPVVTTAQAHPDPDLGPDLEDTRPARGTEPGSPRGRGRKRANPIVVIPVIAGLVGTLGLGAAVAAGAPVGTLAAFTDTGRALATMSSTTLAGPPFETCAVVGTSLLTSAIRLTWTAPAGTAPSEYRIVYTVGGGPRQVVVVPGSALTGDIPLATLGISLGSSAVYTIKVSSAIGGSGGSGGWEVASPKTATATVNLSLIGLVGGSCTIT